MYDDLDRIEGAYGSVAEYYRSRSEETYEEHLQSEQLNRMEDEIKTADDTVRHWDRVVVWDENDHYYDHLLTDKEKLQIVYEERLNQISWGVVDDMSEWIDRSPSLEQKAIDSNIVPEENSSNKSTKKHKSHKR